jgi:hypothetical protein
MSVRKKSLVKKKPKQKLLSKERLIPKGVIPKVTIPTIPTRATLQSRGKAAKAANELERQFKATKSREKRVQIKRQVILAANKAQKRGLKRGISKQEKEKHRLISNVYTSAYQRMVLEEIYEKPEFPAGIPD